jgi:5'-methylthioadenosine phosphorylase
MGPEVAIIGGTGVGRPLMALPGKAWHVPTPAGTLRGKVVQFGGREVFVASRHSAGHKVPPHKVAYSAIALGLKQLGVKAVFSSAAVGSLRLDWPIRTFAVCHDFLDDTGRRPTLFHRTVVHRPMLEPFAESARKALLNAAHSAGVDVHPQAVYVCANGPRYETPQEIRVYRSWGGDVVGMTAASEAILLAEAGVPYACLSVVTNMASGLEPKHEAEDEIEHEKVVNVMDEEWPRLRAIFERAVALVEA